MAIPTVVFMYLTPYQLEYACKCFAGIQIDKLESTFNSYASLSIKNEDGVERIFMGQILYDDFNLVGKDEDLPFNYNDLMNAYNKMVNKYGQEFMDILVIKDNDIIIKNITDVINFIFDDVYKVDTINISFIDNTKDESFIPSNSNYPNLIYSAIQQHFIIKEQIFHFGGRVITIKKRREENVDNAN